MMNAPKPKHIPIVPYKSSQMNGFGYDPETRTLSVEFKSGTYHYHDVSPEEHKAMQDASSFGSHLAKHIKPTKKFTKVS